MLCTLFGHRYPLRRSGYLHYCGRCYTVLLQPLDLLSRYPEELDDETV